MFPKSLEQLHHATIITGNRSVNLESVKSFLVGQNISVQANADLSTFNDEQLTIDTAREIVASVSSKKVSNARFCILSFDRMTTEAQNTLLKTFEEPQEGTYFFILVPNIDTLLPTIRSRCQIIIGESSSGESRLSAQEFLKQKTSERFAYIESWTKSKKDEDNVSKSEVIHFMDELEKVLWERLKTSSSLATPKAIEGIEELFADLRKMREYANIRGASHRVLLDYLAVVTPFLK